MQLVTGVKAFFQVAREKWQDYVSQFKGRNVIVLPDPDAEIKTAPEPTREITNRLVHSRSVSPEGRSQQTPSTNTHLPEPINRASRLESILKKTQKNYQNNRINILIGDMTQLKAIHDLSVDATVCDSSVTSTASTQYPGHIIRQNISHHDEEQQALHLFNSYIDAIEEALQQNLKTVAIPVFSPNEIDNKASCLIALNAIRYCQNNAQYGDQVPDVYFVFPNNKQNRNKYRTMDALLQKKAPTQQAPSRATLKMLNDLLPAPPTVNPHFRFQAKLEWMNNEIKRTCVKLSRGNCSEKKARQITQYVNKVYSKIQGMGEQKTLSARQYQEIEAYLSQQLETLALFQRKQDRIVSRQENGASDAKLESIFPECPVDAKQTMLDDFDSLASQALKTNYQTISTDNGAKIQRHNHGVLNAARTAVWVKALIQLYQKHGDKEAAGIREEDIPLIQMAAIFDASARQNDEGPHLWQVESAQACKQALIQQGVDSETAHQIAASILGKHRPLNKDKTILEKVLHDAIALDTVRKRRVFDAADLNFTRQFSQNHLATIDIETMANEVRNVIHEQQDLRIGVSLRHQQKNIDRKVVSRAFNSDKKAALELAPQPYAAIENHIQQHSLFLADLLENDSFAG